MVVVVAVVVVVVLAIVVVVGVDEMGVAEDKRGVWNRESERETETRRMEWILILS